MPAGDPAGYAQNIGRSAMGLNPITGMMDMAQQGGQAVMDGGEQLIQMLMQLLGQQQMPQTMGGGGNPISGVGVGGMQGNIPLKQKMVR